MHQQDARLDEPFRRLAVDCHGHVGLRHLCPPPSQRVAAREAARASARRSITPAILVRYSAGPRPSEAGAVIASAAATARSTVAASNVEPVRMVPAASAKSGVSPTLVNPIATCATRPPCIASTTAAAAVA